LDRQSREAAGDANSAFSTPTHAQGIIGVDNVRPLTPYVELDLYEKSRRECTPKKPTYLTKRGEATRIQGRRPPPTAGARSALRHPELHYLL